MRLTWIFSMDVVQIPKITFVKSDYHIFYIYIFMALLCSPPVDHIVINKIGNIRHSMHSWVANFLRDLFYMSEELLTFACSSFP